MSVENGWGFGNEIAEGRICGGERCVVRELEQVGCG